jgi:hypothetical protein
MVPCVFKVFLICLKQNLEPDAQCAAPPPVLLAVGSLGARNLTESSVHFIDYSRKIAKHNLVVCVC